MQKLDNGNYDSVIDFLNAANNECRNKENQGVVTEYTKTGDKFDWYGADCRTGNDVQQKLRDGWPQGRAKCEAMMDKIDTSNLVPQDRRRRQIRADMGDHIDMNMVYAGELDRAWTTAKRQLSSSPQRVDILANMLCSGADDESVLFWRGVAAIVLCDKLEAAGYMVRIVVGFGGTLWGNGKVSCRITVKDHGSPLDITTATSVIMPGFFRAIGHGWIAGHCEGKINNPGISVERGKIEPGELDLSHGVKSESSAIAWIKSQIDKLNGPSDMAA